MIYFIISVMFVYQLIWRIAPNMNQVKKGLIYNLEKDMMLWVNYNHVKSAFHSFPFHVPGGEIYAPPPLG